MVKKNLSNKENKKKVSKSKKLSNIEINELNRILFSEPIKYYLVNNRISKLNLQLIDKTTFVKETCKTLNLKDTEIKTIFHWAYLYDTRSIEFYRYINVINILPKLKEYISKSTNVLNVFTHASVVDEVLTTLKSSKKVNFEFNIDLLNGILHNLSNYKCSNFMHILNGKSNKFEEKKYKHINTTKQKIDTTYTLYSTNNLNTTIKLAESIGLNSRHLIILNEISSIRELLLYLPLVLRIQKKHGYMIIDLPYFCFNIQIIQDLLILLGELYESVLMFKNNVTDNINTVTIACQEFNEKNNQYKTKTLKLIDNLYATVLKNTGIPEGLWDVEKYDNKESILVDNQINSIRVFSIMNEDVIDDFMDLYNKWNELYSNKDLIETRRNKNSRYLKKWFRTNNLSYKARNKEVTLLESLFPHKKGVDQSKLQMPGYMGAMATPHLQSLVTIEYIERFMKDIYNKKLSDLTITDATAGIGGDSINFGMYFNDVNSVEISKENCLALKNNIKQFKLDNVEVTCNDYNNVCEKLEQDVIFIDAPWGLDYKEHNKMKLYLGKLELVYFVNLLIKNTDLIVLKVPNNYDFMHFFKKLRRSVTATVKSMSVLQNYYFYIFCYKL